MATKEILTHLFTFFVMVISVSGAAYFNIKSNNEERLKDNLYKYIESVNYITYNTQLALLENKGDGKTIFDTSSESFKEFKKEFRKRQIERDSMSMIYFNEYEDLIKIEKKFNDDFISIVNGKSLSIDELINDKEQIVEIVKGIIK